MSVQPRRLRTPLILIIFEYVSTRNAAHVCILLVTATPLVCPTLATMGAVRAAPVKKSLRTDEGRSDQTSDSQKIMTVAVTSVLMAIVTLTILVLGLLLIWWASRQARRVVRPRGPIHTEMPDLWFLNPPSKRKENEG